MEKDRNTEFVEYHDGVGPSPKGGGRSWLGPPLNPPLCLVVVIGGSRGHVLLLKQISACAPDPPAYTDYITF